VKTLSAPSGRFIFAIILVPFLIQAQPITTKIDSLESLLSSSTGVEKFQVLAGLFNETKQTNFEVALSYARQANLVAKTIGDSVLMVEAGRMIAYSLDDMGKSSEAINILNKSVRIAERNQIKNPELKLKLKGLYNNMGVAYMYVGKYDSSLSYHLKSLELREVEGDSSNISRALNNIGLAYYKLKNSNKALEYYLKSYAFRKPLRRPDDLFTLLLNIGLCYINLDNNAKAYSAFQEALNLCNNNCSELQLMEAHIGLGLMYRSKMDFKHSTDYLQSSLRIARSKNDIRYIIDNLIELGKNELSLKNFRNSLIYLNEAIGLANSSDFNESKINILHELSNVYAQLKDFEKKAFYQDQYISLKDSIYNENLLRNLLHINSGFEERTNLQIIKEKEKALALQNEIIERQRLETILVAIISGLFLFIIILLYSTYRKKVKFEVILEERVKSRTAELENSRHQLEYLISEQNNKFKRTFNKYRAALNNINGIYQLACLETSEPISLKYFTKINEITVSVIESDTDIY
jgi:tetratricopeptide (TPR) repeat protein